MAAAVPIDQPVTRAASGGDVTISVPAGSVTEPATLTFAPAGAPPVVGGYLVARSFDLTMQADTGGATLAPLVAVTVRYDPAWLGGRDPGELAIAEVVDGELRGRLSATDLGAHTVGAYVPGTGTDALVLPRRPTGG